MKIHKRYPSWLRPKNCEICSKPYYVFFPSSYEFDRGLYICNISKC